MYIDGRRIGIDEKPFIIAEIGINHCGKIDVAKKMVESAAKAGADCVKFQIHCVEDEMSVEAKQIVPVNADVSIYDIMESFSLTPDEDYELKKFSESCGVIYMATAFSRKAADQLAEMQVSAIKIGSGECNHLPLLKHIAGFNIPMIVSTGMNTLESVDKSYDLLKGFDTPFAMLHCVNRYPTQPEWVNLRAISQMQERYDIPIGFSDHSVGSEIALSSVALGACIIERHYTDRRDREGPDIACSMDPAELRWLVEKANEVWLALGNGKEPHKEEKVTSDFAFASLVASEDIRKGEMITEHNLWARRPNSGIPVTEYYEIAGKYIAANDIASGKQLTHDDLIPV